MGTHVACGLSAVKVCSELGPIRVILATRRLGCGGSQGRQLLKKRLNRQLFGVFTDKRVSVGTLKITFESCGVRSGSHRRQILQLQHLQQDQLLQKQNTSKEPNAQTSRCKLTT